MSAVHRGPTHEAQKPSDLHWFARNARNWSPITATSPSNPNICHHIFGGCCAEAAITLGQPVQ